MVIKEQILSDLAIPPGVYLEEVILELNMTKDELARRMNRPAPKLSAIFSGQKSITPDTALQLEKVVGVPAHIWTGLEAEYRLTLAKNQQQVDKQAAKAEVSLVGKYCYSQLEKLGFVEKKTKGIEKVMELQRFFGVTSLNNLSKLKRYEAIFRKAKRRIQSPEAISAWLRIGEIEGRKLACRSFEKSSLLNVMPTLRQLTLEPAEDLEGNLRAVLSEIGIAFILCPHFPKIYTHGATFWLAPDKAVLMMTIRGSWSDIFWFSLFHKIGHILLHGKKAVFLEGRNGPNHVFEAEADDFAANSLIPPEHYRRFLITNSFYKGDIKQFAQQLGIHPGIVVGRLQHEKVIKNSWHNDLRSRYEWRN